MLLNYGVVFDISIDILSVDLLLVLTIPVNYATATINFTFFHFYNHWIKSKKVVYKVIPVDAGSDYAAGEQAHREDECYHFLIFGDWAN